MKREYVEKTRKMVLSGLRDENVAIGLFGSVAHGSLGRGSDIDVAIVPKGEWSRWKLSRLRDELEESTIPYKIDLVDLSVVSPEFRHSILQDIVWWRR